MNKAAWVITCEHASNRVPKRYRYLFERAESILRTHRGYDLGAARWARDFSRQLGAPLFMGKYTRLLVELNRSLHHPHLWSEFTRGLRATDKQTILNQYYFPYRLCVQEAIGRLIEKGHRVFHLSVHSFTPVLDGKVRQADIGLLYDPSRTMEKIMARKMVCAIHAEQPRWRIRMNYPYKGISDGFTTSLRKSFNQGNYVGLEIEINQAIASKKRGIPMDRLLSDPQLVQFR